MGQPFLLFYPAWESGASGSSSSVFFLVPNKTMLPILIFLPSNRKSQSTITLQPLPQNESK